MDGDKRMRLKNGNFKTNKLDTTDWNKHWKLEEWREGWAECVNATLNRYGIDERIDHRSYERQGIDKIPTVHLGVTAMQMEQRGIVTDRGNINRKIKSNNELLMELQVEIDRLKKWLDEEVANAKREPNLINALIQIFESGGAGLYKFDYDSIPNSVKYLQENKIFTLSDLQARVTATSNDFFEISDKMKSTDSMIKTIKEHLEQARIYF